MADLLNNKKRNLLPELNSIIGKLAGISADVAKLELLDNFEASKRVRRTLIEIRNIDIKNFQEKIADIRTDIRSKPSARKKEKVS